MGDTSHTGAANDEAGPSLVWLVPNGEPLPTLAGIWATVDLERTLADLRGDESRPAAVGDVHDDPLLGARVVVVSTGENGIPVAIAEPSTEGRLAASLVRHGEGSAGRYVRSPVALATLQARAVEAGILVSRPAIGPFGAAVLVLTGSVAGPHLILVEPPSSRADR